MNGLKLPHAKIRRIVGDMSHRSTEADVRANIRLRCDPRVWPAELLTQAEDYAVLVFRRMKGVVAMMPAEVVEPKGKR